MAEIKLQNGMVALVDDADLAITKKYSWYAHCSKGRWYARANVRLVNGRRTSVKLHRIITSAQAGQQVDHINRNGLDNRRCNLRLVSSGQNRLNQKIRSDNSTGFRGVSKTYRRNTWIAQIMVSGKRKKMYFKTPEEAALAYNLEALKNHGEFAQLNEVSHG